MNVGKMSAASLAVLLGLALYGNGQTSPVATQAPEASATATPAPTTEQKQPSEETTKPGQGVSASQHPSPLPETESSANASSSSKTGNAAPANQKAPVKKSGRKTNQKATHPSKPRRRVIKEGGADDAEVQLSEGMPNDVAMHRRASTATLLSATEENLKRISRHSLSADQQATVNQIRLFMQQSRDAIQQSDVDRAHTLALKAHLLSDSLMRP